MRGISLWMALMGMQCVWAQDAPNAVTTIQLPTFGVSVDARGELTVKAFADPGGRLKKERMLAAKAKLPGNIATRSELRKVSLRGLERVLTKAVESGEPIDEALQYLAGLQRVEYVFLYPAANDVVIAGPAEGWFIDLAGRAVGMTSGRPVVRLDDLAMALRMFPPGDRGETFLGCTIDPPPEGLQRLRQFQRQMPKVISQSQRASMAQAMLQGTRTALGMADVHLFAVSPKSHFGHVLVEADYRMKCMALGLEPRPVEMKSYLESRPSSSANTLQRWWLTPNYERVRLSADGLAMQLVGQGVQLQTEDRIIEAGGTLTGSPGSSNAAAAAFAKSFTANYPAIAAVSPVYAELRNLVDLAITAAWLQNAAHQSNIDCSFQLLTDEKQFPIGKYETPKKVACVANFIWSGNRLIVPAGGGVSITPHEALKASNLLPPDPKLSQKRSTIEMTLQADRWWWD